MGIELRTMVVFGWSDSGTEMHFGFRMVNWLLGPGVDAAKSNKTCYWGPKNRIEHSSVLKRICW